MADKGTTPIEKAAARMARETMEKCGVKAAPDGTIVPDYTAPLTLNEQVLDRVRHHCSNIEGEVEGDMKYSLFGDEMGHVFLHRVEDGLTAHVYKVTIVKVR